MQLTQRRWPSSLTQREADVIASVASSRTWTDGPWTAEVERKMERLTGAPHAVAFNSCTSALHAALHGLDCHDDTRVGVPSMTFAGTITGAHHIGARLLFRDVHPDTLTLTGSTPADADIVIGVDLHGVPHTLNREAVDRAPVLTDACQSLGTEVGGAHIGATGLHAWSFSSAKLVAAPDGGALTTDDEEMAEKLRELRDYGVPRGDHRSNGGVVWPGGHNWRPSELSMTIVALRMEGMDHWVSRARMVTERLHDTLDALGLWRQHAPEDTKPAWHKVRFGPVDQHPDTASRLEKRLADAGVPTHWWGRVPLHRHPVSHSHDAPDLPVTDATAGGTLCLGTEACPPMTWNDDEVENVCRILETIVES